MNSKKQQVLDELMQLGYDFNVISSTAIKLRFGMIPSFEDLLSKVAQRVIFFIQDHHDKIKKYDDETVRRICMRFCLTMGLGIAWMFKYHKNEFNVKGIFKMLAEPRTEHEMDEYIEDIVGIWFSRKSFQHYEFMMHFSRCYDVIKQYYNLEIPNELLAAGVVLMDYGMKYEQTRMLRADVIEPYKGKMQWHHFVWKAIYPCENCNKVFSDWAIKAVGEGIQGQGNYVLKKDMEKEYEVIDNYYRQCVLNENAGIRAIAYNVGRMTELLAATPIFDSKRVFSMVLEKVHVWDNGVEATLTARMINDEDFRITFYDTNYLENKDMYEVGGNYIFDIYGIALEIEEVPEEEQSFRFTGNEAINFNKNIGAETEYDDQGNPNPVIFSTAKLHSLLQNVDEIPELADIWAPVHSECKMIDYLDKKVHAIEIAMPSRNVDNETEYLFTVYSTAEADNGLKQAPELDTPIRGRVYLQGKMRHFLNPNERPSKILHSFDLVTSDGSKQVFTHKCEPEEVGVDMTLEECGIFAKEIFQQHFNESLKLSAYDKSKDSNLPDFYAKRNRSIWVKADSNYDATTLFQNEDLFNGLTFHYGFGDLIQMAYVTLYDENGNKCRWSKGGRFTARVQYGSMTPGQKMRLLKEYNHEELIEILYDSFKELDTRVLAMYLHKDLDFRSHAIPDPIISRQEYLLRTEVINENNRKYDKGPVVPSIKQDEKGESYVELDYPDGYLDAVRIQSDHGFITEIHITSIKGKEE